LRKLLLVAWYALVAQVALVSLATVSAPAALAPVTATATINAIDTAKRKVTRMLLDGEGAIVTLDRDERTVRVWDETGRVLRSVGPTGFKRPADVAVDAFRNLYVADEEAGVLVFNPQGQPLATIASPELRKPRAITLDATGAVLVYDDRAQRVLRYR